MISICFINYILVFAPFVYIELPILSSLRELHFWAMNYDTKIQKSRINICFAVCIFVFAPHLDIELPIGSSGSQFHFWSRGFGLLTRSGAMKKKNSEVYDQYLHWSCILYLLPMYILSSLRSSRRELNFSVMRFGLFVHKGAMTKKIRSIQSISVCWVVFQYLLPMYILSSLQGAQGGSSRRELHFFAMGFGLVIH